QALRRKRRRVGGVERVEQRPLEARKVAEVRLFLRERMRLEEPRERAAEHAQRGMTRWMDGEVVASQPMEVLLPEHGVERGEVLGETIEQAEKIHARINAEALGGAEPLVAADPTFEPDGTGRNAVRRGA